eukprot:751043-Hanusia_phi.AAC.1
MKSAIPSNHSGTPRTSCSSPARLLRVQFSNTSSSTHTMIRISLHGMDVVENHLPVQRVDEGEESWTRESARERRREELLGLVFAISTSLLGAEQASPPHSPAIAATVAAIVVEHCMSGRR